MEKKNITLTSEPRMKFEAQNLSPSYFEASATDGKETYTVRWVIQNDFREKYITCACDFLDDEFACDWKNPIVVYDNDGNNVKNEISGIVF